jgi:hypothetical protein
VGIAIGHSSQHTWSLFGHGKQLYLTCSLSIHGHSGHSGHSKINKVMKIQVARFSKPVLCSVNFVRDQSAMTTMTTMTSFDFQRFKKYFTMTTNRDQKCSTMTTKYYF